ncbi:MAG: hypothetical protein Roseis2KO_02700 [Roseivirga sp.]
MKNLSPYSWRKTIPEELQLPALKALSYYPELQTKKIVFKYTRKEGTSIMKAQPDIKSVLRLGNDRSYVIFVNRTISLDNKTHQIHTLPEEVLTGWFGHELGHVMDYERLGKWGLIRFGISYLLSGSFVKGAEQRADNIAVAHGMGEQILATKSYILNHAGISERYKQKIRKLYPSPEQIMEVIKGQKDIAAIS